MCSSTRDSFEQLVSQARAGDNRARGRLLERYRPYLALLARVQLGRRLQGKVDAADLVQETFLNAHTHFDQFRGLGEQELTAWLRQILAAQLANLVRHYLGTQRRDVRLERDLAAEMEQSSHILDHGLLTRQKSPSEQAVHREEGVLLANALSRLPEDYREVLILRHLEGLTFPEAAQRMERSLDAVKKLWARGLDRLRRSLGGDL
jgi:RNA polymerase sigma-70 factor (ECF subfamily)